MRRRSEREVGGVVGPRTESGGERGSSVPQHGDAKLLLHGPSGRWVREGVEADSRTRPPRFDGGEGGKPQQPGKFHS